MTISEHWCLFEVAQIDPLRRTPGVHYDLRDPEEIEMLFGRCAGIIKRLWRRKLFKSMFWVAICLINIANLIRMLVSALL